MKFKLLFMDQMAFCYPASAASLGSYLYYCQTPSHSHSAYRIALSSLVNQVLFFSWAFTQSVSFAVQSFIFVSHPPPPHYLHQEKGSHLQSQILSQMLLSQQPHNVNASSLDTEKVNSLPKITSLINGSESKPRQFSSRVHLH